VPYNTQGIYTTDNSFRIEMSYLFSKNMLKENSLVRGNITWNNRGVKTGDIGFISVINESEKYIRLIYTNTNHSTNEVVKYDYLVNIIPVKSNLGKGYVYYFECPISKRLCRVLYQAYSSGYFKSRQAFQNRIYYPLQTISKKYYSLQRYYDLESLLNKIYYEKKYFKETYRGKETRAFKRIKKLTEKLEYFGKDNMENLFHSLEKLEKRINH